MIWELLATILAVVAGILAIGLAGWALDAWDWLRDLLR